MDRGGGKRTGLQARAQLIEQASEQKGDRLEFFFGSVEFEFFFETHARFDQRQRAAGNAAGQLMQTNAFLAQTLGKIEGRERGQIPAGSNAPTIERFQQFNRRQQNFHRKNGEARGFFAGIYYGDSRKAAGGDDGNVDGCGYRDIGGHAEK